MFLCVLLIKTYSPSPDQVSGPSIFMAEKAKSRAIRLNCKRAITNEALKSSHSPYLANNKKWGFIHCFFQ